jgi:hypothetical protein
MANASTWPSANRASDKSRAAQSASVAKRAGVEPEPGFGTTVPHPAAISLSSNQGLNCYLFNRLSVINAALSGTFREGALLGRATTGTSVQFVPPEWLMPCSKRSPTALSMGGVPL